VTAVAEVFRQMYAGQLSPEEAANQIQALQAASGAPVSAHEVAAGESDAASLGNGGTDRTSPAAITPVEFNPYLVDGDCSPVEYARLTVPQMTELETIRPGLAARMEKAGVWRRDSEVSAEHERAAAERAEYERRFREDSEFAAGELRKRALDDLESKWWHIPASERAVIAADAGLSTAEYAELAKTQDARAAEYQSAETRVGL
jgi:hypothetical protein